MQPKSEHVLLQLIAYGLKFVVVRTSYYNVYAFSFACISRSRLPCTCRMCSGRII